jgi:hypothetical protein
MPECLRRTRKTDGIYRANLRGESRHVRDRAYSVRSALEKGDLEVEQGKSTLLATRREVQQGWRAVGEILVAQGHPDLAAEVKRFALGMPPPATEREQLAAATMYRAHNGTQPDRSMTR